jgi:leucyl/phenylalanyl-tRNA--protein transferase
VLSTKLLVAAYCHGFFPMAVNAQGEIGWFSPDPRAIIPLDERFHIPHGLKRTLKKRLFSVTFDQQFGAVIRACAKAHESTWISPEIIRSYCRLHKLGLAHSVEVWLNEELAGGLYGVHIGGAFFGESMFHKVTDASKVALVTLVERLRQQGFMLLDTQWTTGHLTQFGTSEIPKAEYLTILGKAIALDRPFSA